MSAARWSGSDRPGVSVLDREVQRDQPPGRARRDRVGQFRDQQVRDHARVPGARSEDQPVGGLDRGDRLGARRPVGPGQPDGVDHAAGRPRPRAARGPSTTSSGRAGSAPRTSASMPTGSATSAAPGRRRCSSAPAWSSAATGSPSSSISPHSTRLPTGCPASGSVPVEPVLEQRGGTGAVAGSASSASAASAWRRSPGGSDAAVGAQPAARPAVVADRDDGGDVERQPAAQRPQRPQRRRRARARRRTRRPCRSSFPPQVAVLRCGGQPHLTQPAGQLLGDRHAAVLAAGAARPRRSGSACPPARSRAPSR